MFTVTKRISIAAAHCLKLPYESPCRRPHGHNYDIAVTVCADSLDPNGMVVDFAAISAIVKRHDHRDLNETMGGIPATAENLAYLIASEVNGEMPARESGGPCAHVERVAVSENDTNLAVWSRD